MDTIAERIVHMQCSLTAISACSNSVCKKSIVSNMHEPAKRLLELGLSRGAKNFTAIARSLGGSDQSATNWKTRLAVAGAALVAIRPADKAAQNEIDVKRYRALMAKACGMTVDQLSIALEEAHQGDAPEVEPLRNVAFNDMLTEINREDQKIPLSVTEKLLRAIA